jgi:hypothetical protein
MKHPPELADGTLYVKAAGGRCLLAIEIVSPSTRVNDVTHKVAHYHQAGVPLYVIVDQEREGGPRSIIAYRWAESGYQRQPLDKEGRLLLEPLGLYLSLADGRVVCHDAATGKKLGDHAQSLLDLDAADRRSLEQEQVIEEAILARQAADRKSREDNQVREEAERKSREDTQARKEAERKSREDTQAREEAEWQARKAVEVQAALEERLRQLEEQLRSRRNGATGSDPAASA